MDAKRGVALIYASLLIALVLGLLSSSWNARALEPADFGNFRFLQSALSVVCTASTLGMLSSAGILLVKQRRRRVSRLVWEGALFQAAIIGFSCSIAAAFIVFWRPEWIAHSMPLSVLSIVAASCLALPLLFQETLRASGDYVGMFFLNCLAPAFYVLGLAFVSFMPVHMDGLMCFVLFLLGQGVVCLVLLLRLKIKLCPSWIGLIYLWKKNLRSGLNVYWATILGTVSAQVGVFILQYFGTSANVAEFSLALTITMPLTMLPSAVGTAYFSKLVRSNGFPPRVLLFSWLGALLVTGVFVLASPYVVSFLYGEKYESVVLLSVICAAASLLHGMGDIYNRYYLANGNTVLLLRVVTGVSIVSVLFGALLGGEYFSIGCAVAKLLSSFCYIAILTYVYHVKKLRYGSN